MARKGIYVNGKEIIARYVGDKLVWKKRRVAYVMYLSTWNTTADDYGVTGYVDMNQSTIPVQTFVNIQIKLDGKIYSVNRLSLSYQNSYSPYYLIEFRSISEASSFYSQYWGDDRRIEILI